MNANFGLLEDLAVIPRDKAKKRNEYATRALADMRTWIDENALAGVQAAR